MESKNLKESAEYYLNCTYNTLGIKEINQDKIDQLGRYINRNKMILWIMDENKKKNPPDEKDFIKLTSPLNELFGWYHVDKVHVVAIPRKLHRTIKHRLNNKESVNRINNIIKDWYRIKYGIKFNFENKYIYIHL